MIAGLANKGYRTFCPDMHDTVSIFYIPTKELNNEWLCSLTYKSMILTNLIILLICKSFVGHWSSLPKITEEREREKIVSTPVSSPHPVANLSQYGKQI